MTTSAQRVVQFAPPQPIARRRRNEILEGEQHDPSSTESVMLAVQREIAREVRLAMDMMRYSERDLAELMGQNQQWVHRRLRGQVAFSGAELVMIADLLRWRLTDFFPRLVHPDPDDDGGRSAVRPRQDSNLQPADYTFSQVIALPIAS